jgi:hypothetical protein
MPPDASSHATFWIPNLRELILSLRNKRPTRQTDAFDCGQANATVSTGDRRTLVDGLERDGCVLAGCALHHSTRSGRVTVVLNSNPLGFGLYTFSHFISNGLGPSSPSKAPLRFPSGLGSMGVHLQVFLGASGILSSRRHSLGGDRESSRLPDTSSDLGACQQGILAVRPALRTGIAGLPPFPGRALAAPSSSTRQSITGTTASGQGSTRSQVSSSHRSSAGQPGPVAIKDEIPAGRTPDRMMP